MVDSILRDLNRRIDHAALKPETAEADIVRLCREAREYELFGVAVNPVWVAFCRGELRGSGVHVIGVAGFPLGANRADVKIEEAIRGAADGAHEIDMVANIGWIRDGRFADVSREIHEVRQALPYNVVLKVIIEAGLLTEAQRARATQAVVDGGAQFVKTSTGFFSGATAEMVRSLAEAAQGKIAVKASGGIRTLEDCRRMLEAGATRLGSSASAGIMEELRAAAGADR